MTDPVADRVTPLLRGMAGFGVVLLLIVLAGFCRPDFGFVRDWRLQQEVPLADGITMRMEDLYLYPTAHTDLLRVRCRWIGGNPNDHYALRATIRTERDGPEINRNIMWQVGVIKSPEDGDTRPFCWEFRDAPRDAKRIYLRVYYRPKNQQVDEKSVSLDFANIPRLTPNGETPLVTKR